PPTALYIQAAATCHHARQVPPFGHPRINARLAAPRGLSRPPTSFIGAWCQGIHRVPHSLGHHRNKTLAHTIHKSKPTPHTQPTHTTRHAPARMARTTPHTPTPTTTTHRRQPQPSTSTHQPESPTTSQPINHRPTSHKAPKPPQAPALNNDPWCGVCGIRLFPPTPNSAPPPTTNDRQGNYRPSNHTSHP